jgi:hypothetical protein
MHSSVSHGRRKNITKTIDEMFRPFRQTQGIEIALVVLEKVQGRVFLAARRIVEASPYLEREIRGTRYRMIASRRRTAGASGGFRRPSQQVGKTWNLANGTVLHSESRATTFAMPP